MNLFAQLIADFGRRIGVAGLAPNDTGVVDLEIERLGRLQLEERDGRVFVTLARARPGHDDGVYRRLLDACHWRHAHPWPLHPGAKGDDLLTLTAVERVEDVDVPELERVIGYVANAMDSAESGREMS